MGCTCGGPDEIKETPHQPTFCFPCPFFPFKVHSTGLVLRGCVIANHGNLAVNLTNCSHSVVHNCTVADTGDGGVWLQGGNRSTLAPGNLTASGTTFTRYNRWGRTYRPARTRAVAHNLQQSERG